ncbi:MAG: sugar ABC transporter permease [Clostridia bacterium]|nr:sugar ABC transporter permease [Clostridia bacterium]
MSERVLMERSRSQRIKKTFREIIADYPLYIMILPGLLYFIIFHYLPMFGVSIAFTDYNIVKGFGDMNFVGWKWFDRLFSRKSFTDALFNNIKYSLLKLCCFPLPILLSIIISEVWNNKYKRVVQTMVIMPSFLSWFIVYGILKALLNVTDGVLPALMTWMNNTMGTNFEIVNFMTNKATFTPYVLITYAWKEIGMGTVVYLAAIVAIDQQLYEAAMIDGAGRMKQIRHILLPSLLPTIITLFIFRVGKVMDAGFDQMFALSNPLVTSAADIIDTYVYRVGLEEAKFSQATAAGLFKSAIGLCLVLFTNWLARRVDPDSAIM